MNIISNTNRQRKSSAIDGRLAIRQRFQLASAFLEPLRTLIQLGFATQRRGKTAFGRAMSYLLLRAVAGEYPDQYVDPAAVRLSEGVLQLPIRTVVTREAEVITVEMRPFGDGIGWLNAAWDDRLVLCAYHPELRIAGINEQEYLRETGIVTITLPPRLMDKPVQLYLTAHDRYRRRWSNSKYLGEF